MEKDIKQIFAERLKELREDKDFSIRQLAREVNISNSELWRFENSLVDAKAYQVAKLAVYFGVTCDYLLGLEN